ncbi:chromatin accessibility complex 16kD protein [Bombus vosnesenskii]|uniref:Chromatin accessibility complex protein 1 n=4 Tax=Bombus TaxID=28641 RepID=A0A6J3JSV6_9HYME|nr:chromatin accessibility complex 16kD protein [Bombus terrestris]XP_024222824.1 chromatin accessibility complex 16kD protein [Bombus impatiens]XP_033202075.1 chromatin accessibility complex 16kD protein-like [Bombus vancouverensis nearcticus]XP_033298220.1 chromatin accessibility complex 16kD protein [Bombus bifarius]XP_033343180.1 chromatin accessibility complex 16kD protein [Bombus vosnesenskii]XP_043589580.1 chromatin accessibility complex 16kD protein-like [Bombus pyrosoma]XP_050474307.
MTAQGSHAKMKELRLPMSRVKTIMKSSPYVDTIGQDGLYLVTKATELFIHYLTEEAHLQNNKGNSLDYKHLAEVVQTNDTLEFLREIMPRKITVRQFKEMMAAKNSHSSSSESSSDSDSDSESDTDSCSDSDRKAEDDNSSNSEQESEAKENGKCDSASDKSEASDKSDSEDETKR